MIVISAFMLGLISSWHCAGMCGPIAIALPPAQNKMELIISRIIFNCGRILTYMLLGAMFGLLGQGISIGGFQQMVAIASGILILLMAVFSFSPDRIVALFPGIASFQKLILNAAKYFLKKSEWYHLLAMGMINGCLPCGVVYLALAGAISSGTLFLGINFMMWFGLGTLPMMLSIALAGNQMTFSFRNKIKKVTPFIMVFFAAVIILRGLNLNIPFLSPPIPEQVTTPVKCH